MSGIIGLIIFVLDIVAILDIIKNIKDTGKKVLWIVLVLVLPLVGMVAYFLIGKKK